MCEGGTGGYGGEGGQALALFFLLLFVLALFGWVWLNAFFITSWLAGLMT